jgi:hypothetical protein
VKCSGQLSYSGAPTILGLPPRRRAEEAEWRETTWM